jgi:tRNA pseudouridine13 synthase
VHLDGRGLPTNEFEQATVQSLSGVKKALKMGKMQVAVPLIGFKQHPSEGVQGEIEKGIIKDENVIPRDFYIPSLPEISAPGRLRTVLVPISDLSVEEASRDSSSPLKRKLRLSFTLHRGSYATVLLREFMKPRNLIKAGF